MGMDVHRPRARFPVLYIEDEENDIILMQQAFKKAMISHPLKVARDGQMALDYLSGSGEYANRQAHPMPGLMLLDLNLPGRSGFEVLGWIRTHIQAGSIVLICSSSGDPEDIRKSYVLGANGYVMKPSGFDNLFALVCAMRDYWLVHNEMLGGR